MAAVLPGSTRWDCSVSARRAPLPTLALMVEQGTEDARQKAAVFLKPLTEIRQPVSMGLFAGAMIATCADSIM